MANYQTPASRGGGAPGGGRVVGDYMLGKEIGKGAFSVVWAGRHRFRGTEVAVKEIIMDKLTKKLKDSLLSEVHILRRINHPNIISLYDSIEEPDRIYLILEYCRGGDLYMYIQRHGRVPEATAKHFMSQLASGLKILRDNSVVHRDLKPQNILLLSSDESSVLKIADFGFAKVLQTHGMAETLCGSPLYMAPEVMQVQRYDAKADLWSIGVILFQLVTGHTPYNGANQIQLLQNILKSNELRFPPGVTLSTDCIDLCKKLLKRNPVERLTMEEFLNHQFLIDHNSDGSLSPARPSGQSSHEDCMPFILDVEPTSTAQDESPFNYRSPQTRDSYRFPFPSKLGKTPDLAQPSKQTGFVTKYGGFEGTRPESCTAQPRCDYTGTSPAPKEPKEVIDSMELLEGYVVVSAGPHADSASSSSTTADASRRSVSLSPSASPNLNPCVTAPMPIQGAIPGRTWSVGNSPASGNSQGSVEMGEAVDRPSSDYMTRIKSLQHSASAVSDLVKDEVSLTSQHSGKELRAFSVQLVVLAIWKQAMQICHKVSAASAVIEGSSPSRRSRSRPGSSTNSSFSDSELADSLRARIEKEFLLEVSRAEELASYIAHVSETTDMPDAIEIIFQAALTSGRDGGVDEMMGNTERAALMYAKAVALLRFLLVEAPLVDLNPPFSLTKSDRYRLRSYIEVLTNRLSQLHSLLRH
ncbi:hypothetical protein LUZ60_012913 [Juncus effusus]|nr:hypothetical protein LUZ60_012913 [Juncus effusus]